jgi:hypothetical protein
MVNQKGVMTDVTITNLTRCDAIDKSGLAYLLASFIQMLPVLYRGSPGPFSLSLNHLHLESSSSSIDTHNAECVTTYLARFNGTRGHRKASNLLIAPQPGFKVVLLDRMRKA